MEHKPLGRSGRTISSIGLGCVTFGREIDEQASYRVMDYAVEKGITFFDTAAIYGGGQARIERRNYLGFDEPREATQEMSSSERILGRWMRSRGCREEITVCTKFLISRIEGTIGGALEESLDRLGTDYLDIYKLHAPDADTPIDETLAAMTEEMQAGRVRVIGCSNHSASQLREALEASAAGGYNRFEVTQPLYNLVVRQDEEDLLPLCKEAEIAVTAYSPLGAGFLAGKYTADRSQFSKGSRFHILPDHADIYFSEENFLTVERLRSKSAELGIPMVKLAMAWVMSHPDVTSVLIGARTTEHIDNALAAYEMGLDPALRAELAG